MANNTQRTTSIQRRLNTRLKTNPAFVELAKAVDRVTRETVTAPRDELATIRDPRRHHRGDWMTLPDGRRAIINHIAVREDGQVALHTQVPNTSETYEVVLPSNLQDRSVLINNARYHGFNYFSDTLSTEDYARVVEYIEDFWPESGTSSYYKFMGFIKKVKLYADTLWSTDEGMPDNPDDPDQYPFLEANFGQYRGVWEGGTDYPTSHVQLRYDRVKFPETNEFDLFQLFYLLAPIHLVLERIVSDIEGGTLYLTSTARGSMALFESGLSDFAKLPDTDTGTTIALGNGALALFEAAALISPRRRYLPVLNVDIARYPVLTNTAISDWLWAYTRSVVNSEFRMLGGETYRKDRTPRSLGRLGGIAYKNGLMRGTRIGGPGYEDGPFARFSPLGGLPYDRGSGDAVGRVGGVGYRSQDPMPDYLGGIDYETRVDNRVPVNRAPLGPQMPDQPFSLRGGIQFGTYLGDVLKDIQSASVEISQGGKRLANYDTRESTRIYYHGGYIGVYIPPEYIPASWTGNEFQYVISIRRGYGSTRILEGTIQFNPAPIQKPLIVNPAVGLAFSLGLVQDDTTLLDASQYDFAMKVSAFGPDVEIDLSTENGRLYPTDLGTLAGFVPLEAFSFVEGAQYTYRLYWRHKAEQITTYTYREIFTGPLEFGLTT